MEKFWFLLAGNSAMLLLWLIALLRPNAKENAKSETYLNENVVISGNIAQLPGECNLCNVSEQAWYEYLPN